MHRSNNDTESQIIKKASTGPLFPKLSVSLKELPVNLTRERAGSLTGLALPKLSARSGVQILSPSALSPTLSKKSAISPSVTPLYRKLSLPILTHSVKSNKVHGIVNLYCANTHKGIIRDYNEDRVMIMLRIPKPADRKDEKWPFCSFFGLYDGHGGKNCSNFLRDNLHLYITQDINFPSDPQKAIIKGFQKAESTFIDIAIKKKDKSGSCAVIVLVVGKKCYIANLGDSRAIISSDNGNSCSALTKDHKPDEDAEKQRILNAGGEVYYSGQSNETFVSRILPGRLAVSRAFGDIEAKLKELGGNPDVLIAIPEIKIFPITSNVDFIGIGSDGIFDKLENKDVVDIIWSQCINLNRNEPLIKLTQGVENVLIEAMNRESLDNVTLLVLAFENFINGTRCKNG
jgi:protein phosphatase PTC2/3